MGDAGVIICSLQYCYRFYTISCYSIIMKTIIMLSILASSALSGPTVYKIDEEKNTAESVIVPVSSTVIPLDDLPELKVGYGFGLVDKETLPKPTYLKDIKLITSANKHRFIVPGGVKQLTKEEFEAFTNQV